MVHKLINIQDKPLKTFCLDCIEYFSIPIKVYRLDNVIQNMSILSAHLELRQ